MDSFYGGRRYQGVTCGAQPSPRKVQRSGNASRVQLERIATPLALLPLPPTADHGEAAAARHRGKGR